MSDPSTDPAPGGPTIQMIAGFDRAVDDWFDRLRGRPVPDRVFEVASHLGDWGLIWNMAILALALPSEEATRRAPRLIGAFAIESLIVNQVIKRAFRRTRPLERPEVSGRLREPLTSSFPSGHASSAAFAVVVLGAAHPRIRLPALGVGVIVATSRIHTRMHHPSDVVAGAGVGWLLGRAARRALGLHSDRS